MPPLDTVLRAWWPTTQSLDLVEAPLETTALAVQAEFGRFAGEPIDLKRDHFDDLGAALAATPDFDNVVTHILLLPTRSKWTVLWHNTFLCNGYDSLCWCLTSHHFLTTIHWSAHDEWTTFQSGSHFHFRRHDNGVMIERSVQVAQTDRRWDFFESGEPLPEEDIAGYRATKKRDRLNELRTIDLLARLGAEPWKEAFYAFPGDAIAMTRPTPKKAIKRSRAEVLRPVD